MRIERMCIAHFAIPAKGAGVICSKNDVHDRNGHTSNFDSAEYFNLQNYSFYEKSFL